MRRHSLIQSLFLDPKLNETTKTQPYSDLQTLPMTIDETKNPLNQTQILKENSPTSRQNPWLSLAKPSIPLQLLLEICCCKPRIPPVRTVTSHSCWWNLFLTLACDCWIQWWHDWRPHSRRWEQ
ncbi:uncharacterized protein LOC120146607 [Hibiscus syriacus]|uniref:uncharacterized protein LOC120146607 n=1 Tax=Hibiscus syriacus TaxID=106335 RepID=UPI0019237060|nr:uncharacterized protein LOC120146607 [Hibiscus syriacus]